MLSTIFSSLFIQQIIYYKNNKIMKNNKQNKSLHLQIVVYIFDQLIYNK